jgi:hypothetical protein
LRTLDAAAFVTGRAPASARLARVIVVGFLGAAGDPGTLALEIARRAAGTGARVEMVGVAGPDPAGDTRLIELASAGIGHATVVRSAADRLEAADLDLALRYLPDVRAMVLVAPDASLIAPAAAASGWSGAGLVIVAPRSDGSDADAGKAHAIDAAPQAIVLDPPRVDRDGTFAGLVAALATRLDAGDDPTTAWQSTVSALAVDPISR